MYLSYSRRRPPNWALTRPVTLFYKNVLRTKCLAVSRSAFRHDTFKDSMKLFTFDLWRFQYDRLDNIFSENVIDKSQEAWDKFRLTSDRTWKELSDWWDK